MRSFASFMDRFSVFIGHCCAILLFVCIALSAFEVFMRYVMNMPTQWTFETVMALCATSWAMTSGYVTERRRHIAITVLEVALPRRVWLRMELLAMVVSVGALTMLIIGSWEPAAMALDTVERSGSAFNPPLPAYLKPLLVVGATLYILQLFANIYHWFAARNAESKKGDA